MINGFFASPFLNFLFFSRRFSLDESAFLRYTMGRKEKGASTMKISILDAATLGEDLSLSLFEQYGEVTVYGSTTPEQVEERLADAEAVILNKIKLNPTNLKNAKNLKIILEMATGFDNIDLEYCKSRTF